MIDFATLQGQMQPWYYQNAKAHNNEVVVDAVTKEAASAKQQGIQYSFDAEYKKAAQKLGLFDPTGDIHLVSDIELSTRDRSTFEKMTQDAKANGITPLTVAEIAINYYMDAMLVNQGGGELPLDEAYFQRLMGDFGRTGSAVRSMGMEPTTIQHFMNNFNTYTTGQASASNTPPTSQASARCPDFNATIANHAKKLILQRGGEEDDVAAFEKVLQKSSLNNGHENPIKFLNSLSSKEMESVRLAHGLAADIVVDGLDFEGAFNLLRVPENYIDLNHNGLFKVGLGDSRVFPPAAAPVGVKDAWDQAVAGINAAEGLKAIISRAPFFAAELGANIKYGPDGTPIGVYQPDEPGHINLYDQPGFTYKGMVGKLIAGLENQPPPGMTAKNYLLTMDFLKSFQAGLSEKYIA